MILYNRDVCSSAAALKQEQENETSDTYTLHCIVSLISDTIIPLIHHVISRMEAGHVQLLR